MRQPFPAPFPLALSRRVAVENVLRNAAEGQFIKFATGVAVAGGLWGEPRAVVAGVTMAVAKALIKHDTKVFGQDWQHSQLRNSVTVTEGGHRILVRRESHLVARRSSREYSTRFAWAAGAGDPLPAVRVFGDFTEHEVIRDGGYVRVTVRCKQAVRPGTRMLFGFETVICEAEPLANPVVAITPSVHGYIRDQNCILELAWDATSELTDVELAVFRNSADRTDQGATVLEHKTGLPVVLNRGLSTVSLAVDSGSAKHFVLGGRLRSLPRVD
jgi:hypothetical protein